MTKKTILFILLLLLSACSEPEIDQQKERELMTAVLHQYLTALAQQDMDTLHQLHTGEPTWDELQSIYQQSDIALFANYQNLEIVNGAHQSTSLYPIHEEKGYLTGNILFANDFVSGFHGSFKRVPNTETWRLSNINVYPPDLKSNCAMQPASEAPTIELGLCDAKITRLELSPNNTNYRLNFDFAYKGEKTTLCFATWSVKNSNQTNPLAEYYEQFQYYEFHCLPIQNNTSHTITMLDLQVSRPELTELFKTGDPMTYRLIVAHQTEIGEIIEDQIVYIPIHEEIVEFQHQP